MFSGKMMKGTLRISTQIHALCRGCSPRIVCRTSERNAAFWRARNFATFQNRNNIVRSNVNNTFKSESCNYRTSAIIRANVDGEENVDSMQHDPEVRKLLKEITQDFESAYGPLSNVGGVSSSDSNNSYDGDASSEDGSVQADVTSNENASSQSSMEPDATSISEFEDFGDEVEYEWVEEERQAPVQLTRGKLGVYDIEELVAVLRSENGRDICVIEVPPEYRYVDYLVIVSATSFRHMKAIAEYIKLLFKRKRNKSDKFAQIEGLDSRNWMAMDLGNIALHIFMPETREYYDIETLWTCGSEFDEKLREERDPYLPLTDSDFSILDHSPYGEYSATENEPDSQSESFESGVYHAPSQEESLRPPKVDD